VEATDIAQRIAIYVSVPLRSNWHRLLFVNRVNLKMPIAETVVSLAKCVAKARSPLTEWERSLYDALLKMPEFREQDSLDAWEKQFLEALAKGEFVEESSNSCLVTSQLLKAIFELGRYNLYTAFDTPGVRRELNALVRCLRVNHNIEPPAKE
jgi:hypothetical protein